MEVGTRGGGKGVYLKFVVPPIVECFLNFCKKIGYFSCIRISYERVGFTVVVALVNLKNILF